MDEWKEMKKQRKMIELKPLKERRCHPICPHGGESMYLPSCWSVLGWCAKPTAVVILPVKRAVTSSTLSPLNKSAMPQLLYHRHMWYQSQWGAIIWIYTDGVMLTQCSSKRCACQHILKRWDACGQMNARLILRRRHRWMYCVSESYAGYGIELLDLSSSNQYHTHHDSMLTSNEDNKHQTINASKQQRWRPHLFMQSTLALVLPPVRMKPLN